MFSEVPGNEQGQLFYVM